MKGKNKKRNTIIVYIHKKISTRLVRYEENIKVELNIAEHLVLNQSDYLNVSKNDQVYYGIRIDDRLKFIAAGWVKEISNNKNNTYNVFIHIPTIVNKIIDLTAEIHHEIDRIKEISVLNNDIEAAIIPESLTTEIDKLWDKSVLGNYTGIEITESHRYNESLKKILNEFSFDTLHNKFVQTEALVVSLLNYVDVLQYCKENFIPFTPLEPSREQCMINGFGTLQTLVNIQNCIKKIHKYVLGIDLPLPNLVEL